MNGYNGFTSSNNRMEEFINKIDEFDKIVSALYVPANIDIDAVSRVMNQNVFESNANTETERYQETVQKMDDLFKEQAERVEEMQTYLARIEAEIKDYDAQVEKMKEKARRGENIPKGYFSAGEKERIEKLRNEAKFLRDYFEDFKNMSELWSEKKADALANIQKQTAQAVDLASTSINSSSIEVNIENLGETTRISFKYEGVPVEPIEIPTADFSAEKLDEIRNAVISRVEINKRKDNKVVITMDGQTYETKLGTMGNELFESLENTQNVQEPVESNGLENNENIGNNVENNENNVENNGNNVENNENNIENNGNNIENNENDEDDLTNNNNNVENNDLDNKPTQSNGVDGTDSQPQNDMAKHCYKIRSARKAKFASTVKVTSLTFLAAAGLGMITGFAPAVAVATIAASATGIVSGVQVVGDIVDGIRRASVKHKLKKAVRKTGLKLIYDYENGTVKYGYKDGKDVVLLSSENRDLANEIQRNLDEEFAYINGPKREKIFAGNPRVTVDNLEAAYAEFGGLLTKKERGSWSLADGKTGWKSYISDLFKRNKEALEDERSNADEVSIEELEQANELEADEEIVSSTEDYGDIDTDELDAIMDVDVDEDEALDEVLDVALDEDSTALEQPVDNPEVEVISEDEMEVVPTEEVPDISSLHFEDMFKELDENSNDVNSIDVTNEAEIEAALNSDSLTPETAIAYIQNNDDLNNNLIVDMVDKGIISQDQVDVIMIDKSKTEGKGLN